MIVLNVDGTEVMENGIHVLAVVILSDWLIAKHSVAY